VTWWRPPLTFNYASVAMFKRPLTLNAADYRALIWLGMGPVNLKRLCDTFQCDKSADDIHS